MNAGTSATLLLNRGVLQSLSDLDTPLRFFVMTEPGDKVVSVRIDRAEAERLAALLLEAARKLSGLGQ